jgi:hypothetical protein
MLAGGARTGTVGYGEQDGRAAAAGTEDRRSAVTQYYRIHGVTADIGWQALRAAVPHLRACPSAYAAVTGM